MRKNIAVLWLIKRIRRRIPTLAVLTAVHMGQALLGVAFALGTRQVIDSAIGGELSRFRSACLQQGAVILGILLCLTAFRHWKEQLSCDLDRDWKKQILHGLLHGRYDAVSAYHSAELLNRMNSDVQTVNDGILTVLPNVMGMVMRLAAAVLALLALDPQFTLLIAGLGIVTVLLTGAFRKAMKSLHKQVREQDGIVSAFLQEVMEKLLMVQAMDVTEEVEHRTDGLLDRRLQIQKKRRNLALAANTGVSLLYYGAGFLALIWCAGRMLKGEMSFGSLTAVTQLVSQLQTPFVGLSGVFPKYTAMLASAERLMELEQIPVEENVRQEDVRELYDSMDSLCAENLRFSYDRDEIFAGADFSLPKGAFAVVTGPSGMGKSTLLKLLLGIFRPEEGRLYLDCRGERVTIDRSCRRLFAYVPQGNLLLSGTLRENLTIIRPEATEAELAQAVYVSAMDEYLDGLPLGLDTVLGENAAGLSEGQAQRLAIARAVLGGAPVLLLDECTSALDADTEERVLRRLRDLPNRTCIAVTHRPAALTLCDWQLKLENGKIQTEKNGI